MTTRDEFVNYQRAKTRLEDEITKAKASAGLQEMPDDVWEDETRRMEWLAADKAQWNWNTGRLARLTRLQDRCFPRKSWVIEEVEKFFDDEEGPLY